MSERDQQEERLEREVDEMQQRTEHLEEEIEEARHSASEARRDAHIPGAGPDPASGGEDEPPPEQEYPTKRDEG